MADKNPSSQYESGEVRATKLIATLIGPAADLGMESCEKLCKNALEINGDFASITKHESTKKTVKKVEKKTVDLMFSKISTLLPNQLKNQSLRFGVEMPLNVAASRTSWAGFKPFGGSSNNAESRNYDDVIDLNILTAPICDVCIVQSGDPIPAGFYRIYKTPKNKKANLNSQSGGHPIYLCVRKDMTGGSVAPVTNFIVFFPDRLEYVPPGYYIVQRGTHACNLNTGTSAERVYLCYKKDLGGNPVTDVQVVFPSKGEDTPASFCRIDKSFSGVAANLNSGTNGLEAYLCYHQRLARLDVLLNECSSSSPLDSPAVSDPRARQHRRASFKIIPGGVVGGPNTIGCTEDFRKISLEAAAATASNGKAAGLTGSSNSTVSFGEMPTAKSETDLAQTGRDAESAVSLPRASSKSVDIIEQSTRGRSKTADSAASVASTDEPDTPRPVAGSSSKVASSLDTSSVREGADEEDEDDDDLLPGDGEWDEGFEGQDAAFQAVTEDDGTCSARRNKEVVDAAGKLAPLRSRRALLAILSAVYVRHGAVAGTAIAGLSALLTHTDFFEHDLKGLPPPGAITMMDLCIETVCDRFDLSSESEHDALLQLIRLVIKHSGARLSPSSLQRMFRAISFLCNIHSTKSNWVASGAPMPCNEPGEALTPFRVLKHLISDTVAQVELISFSNFLPDTDATYVYEGEEEARHSQAYLDVRVVVEDLVEGIIDSVEVSRLSEAAYLAISKQSITTTSGLFWDSVNVISRRLFSDYQNRSAFVTLCAVSKQAWMGIRTNSKGEPVPRDLGIKLLALEAVTEFCLCAGDKMRNNKIMGYQIRRIVVPCVLYNVSYALVDHRIFSKLLKIVTALWKKWRHCVRIEFAILCEQLIVRVLQASVVQIRPIFQMIVIQEVINWFDQPHLLVEMFVNYDMDRKFVSHWNTFSHLVRTVCNIGRRLTLVTGAWDWRPGGLGAPPEESNRVSITIRDVHLQALEEVGHIAKTLMDASGHAYLIMQDEGFRNRSLGATGGWIEDDETGSGGRFSKESPVGPAGDETVALNGSSPAQPASGRKRVGSVRMRRAQHQEAEELIREAIKIYREKDSLKKAIAYLIKQNFVADTPQEITNFLRVYKNNFDPAAIGDYLGEGGVTPREVDYWSQIRFRYTRAVSFVEMDLEPALRRYLTGCGFRLPGEAQKIDRFVEVFVKAFWQDNGGTPNCPFKHQDTVHLLAYAVIMLNTDLHRANTDKKKNQKMSKEQFINNLRGADQGTNIDRDYLGRIYDSIEAHAIELDVAVKPLPPPPTVAGAISAALPLPGSSKKGEEDRKVAGGDMASNALAAAGGKALSADVRIAEEKKFIKEVCRSLRDSEDLLRSLSPFTYRFQSGLLSLDLVSCMYETVWFHFHAIAESLLSAPITDTYVKFAALDILCYSLTSAIFLDLKVERMTFADLLKTFRETVEKGPRNPSSTTGEDAAGSKPPPDNSWYEEVENANQYTSMDTIAKVHHLMVHIKDSIQATSSYELTRQVASRFEKKTRVLENNIFFVRQGELVKLNRASRPVSYQFFLFSDYLMYAHLTRSNEYRVHEQLSLNAMTVSDNEADASCTSFYVSHPVKSFFIVAESPLAKQQWMRDINQTIDSCRKREKTKPAEGGLKRRMSIYERIDSQQSAQGSHVIAPAYTASPGRKAHPEQHAVPRTGSRQQVDVLADVAEFQAVPFSTTPVKGGGGVPMDFNIPVTGGTPPKPPTPPLPTAEQRAEVQSRAVETFRDTVRSLSGDALSNLYQAGVTFHKGMQSARGGSSYGSALSEAQQLRLFGLMRHVKAETAKADSAGEGGSNGNGSAVSKEPAMTADQQSAFDACRGLGCEEAKREVLGVLFSAAPYWKYEQFL